MFTDESYIKFETPHNFQNNRCWSENNPFVIHEHVNYPKKLMCFCAMHWAVCIVWPFWIETNTLDSQGYCDLLNDHLYPALACKFHAPQLHSHEIYQQDSARCHTSQNSMTAGLTIARDSFSCQKDICRSN